MSVGRKRAFRIAEATIYIATANKSNSAYLAIDAALEDVRSGRTLAVPEHLRDASYQGAKRLGHGEGYQYAHDGEGHFVPQDYLGADKRYYEPTEQGVEKKIKERLDQWRQRPSPSSGTWQGYRGIAETPLRRDGRRGEAGPCSDGK